MTSLRSFVFEHLRRARAFVPEHAREIADGLRRLWWIFVIVMPLSGLACWIAIDYSNASQDRQQAAYRRDQDHRQAQYRRQLQVKFQQALRISSAQYAFSINKGVCGWRAFGQPQLDRAFKRRKIYATLSPAERALNENAIKTVTQFLANQVTVPPDFDCSTLPKKPPKSGRTP